MSELAQAIEEMRNMRESYDQLAATADLYQQGRTALASAITAKGVPTTADTPLADMAENVGDIQQVTTTIDGGDMYAAQLFGDGALWNLYDVLAQMKSQYMGAGHYAALIVCEYYKGYDSLQLQGADAYYTCDGDFYDTSAPLHVWHDSENGKSNRWVCFLFSTEGARLDITNTDISPRSMYIGGHIGTIDYFVSGRLTDLVCGVEETDVVDLFMSENNAYTQAFVFNTTLINIKSLKNIRFSNGGTVTISNTNLTGDVWSTPSIITSSASFINIIGAENARGVSADQDGALETFYTDAKFFQIKTTNIGSSPRRIITPNALSAGVTGGSPLYNLIDLWVGALTTSYSFALWNPTNVLTDATKKAQLIENIKNHILARVSDRTGLSQLVFTVSTNMYNNIASEQIEWQGETMTLADAFLTKNWRLAGA